MFGHIAPPGGCHHVAASLPRRPVWYEGILEEMGQEEPGNIVTVVPVCLDSRQFYRNVLLFVTGIKLMYDGMQ
jgi:hypothetical protein